MSNLSNNNRTAHYENHQRAAELHDLAAHAHRSAAVAHEKQDHASGHERSRKALEHSEGAFQHTEQAHQSLLKGDAAESVKQEDIAAMAFGLWQARGCPEGSSDKDWLRAERELWAKTSSLRM